VSQSEAAKRIDEAGDAILARNAPYYLSIEDARGSDRYGVRSSGDKTVITRLIPTGIVGTQPGQSTSDIMTHRPVSVSDWESGDRTGDPISGREVRHNVVVSTDPPEDATNGSGLAGVGPGEDATETPAGGMVNDDAGLDPADAGGDLSGSSEGIVPDVDVAGGLVAVVVLLVAGAAALLGGGD
jgi:hypothetical protein